MDAPSARSHRVLVIALIVIGGALPVALYWLFFGGVPTVTPAEAKELLTQPDAKAVLVDVRPSEAFGAQHLDGAVSWPYEEVQTLGSAAEAPKQLRGKTLLVLCESGMLSALAVRKVRELGLKDALNVKGGMQAWVAGAGDPCGQSFCRLRLASGDDEALPFRESPLHEQWMAIISGFVIKPAYMVLSLILIAILWRRNSPDLVVIRWALIAFFVGEAFCAVNYVVYGEESLLFEYLHCYGMVLAFGLTTHAFAEGVDRRLVYYSAPGKKCAALGLCRSCIKYTEAPCGLKRLFLFLLPMLVILSFIPLVAAPRAISYNTNILGALYNYAHLVPHQVFEIRYCPVIAILCFAASLLTLVLKKDDPVPLAKVFLACGTGPLAFGVFRLFLSAAYADDMVWFVFWEELTELLYVAGVAAVLWVFPGALSREADPHVTFPDLPRADSSAWRLEAKLGYPPVM